MPEAPPPTLSCLIVEDNEMNRLTLAHFVELTPGLTLAAAVPDGVAALHYLQTHPAVDLLLLDIEMPHLTGLDLVRVLPEPRPAVVLVTSHENFAVQAFELPVTDYLLKPVEYARFLLAIQLVRKQRDSVTAALPAPALVSSDLFVKVNGKLVRLDFDEVLYIEALSDYVNIATAKQKYVVYSTLKNMDEQLPFAHFMRVHRSYIVNLQRIDALEEHALVVGPYEVPVGKSYYPALRNRLNAV